MRRDEAEETIRQIQEIGALLNRLTDYVESLSIGEDEKMSMRRGIAEAMIGMNEHTLLVVLRRYPDLDPY